MERRRLRQAASQCPPPPIPRTARRAEVASWAPRRSTFRRPGAEALAAERDALGRSARVRLAIRELPRSLESRGACLEACGETGRRPLGRLSHVPSYVRHSALSQWPKCEAGSDVARSPL